MAEERVDRAPEAERSASSGICAQCRTAFEGRRDKRFCSDRCRTRFGRERKVRAHVARHTMGPEHRAHVARILSQLGIELRAKYARGQAEHGGELWKAPNLLESAIEEVIDLAVYLFSLREQQR